MYKFIILIENKEISPTLDQRWPEFIHVVKKMPNLLHTAIVRVDASLYGNADISMILELYFDCKETLERAMVSPSGQKAGQILQAVTQGRMTLLVTEHLEDIVENLSRYRTRTPEDLEIYLKEKRISGTIIFLDVPEPNIEAAADAIGVAPNQILKSLLFSIGEEYVLVITCGDDPVERQVIAKHLDVDHQMVKLTPSDEVIQVTGYAEGTLPPFGYQDQLKTLLDRRAMLVPYVYAYGGAKNAFAKLNPYEIQRYTQAKILDLSIEPND
jgi:prolyl-tRNA editing enzyme YbaK/EbsC (Cys-tRNA(Pro) deacylase)